MTPPSRIRNTTPLSLTVLVAFGLGGCAIHPVPSLQLEHASAAISAASVAGADDSLEELALARGKFALTQRWLNARDNEPVRWLAEQAQVDAELASVKVAATSAERAVMLARRDRPSLVRTTLN